MEPNFVKNAVQFNLTKVQLRIADYIGKNKKRILGMTAQEIGKEIGVSDASVIRFARAVGYEGFMDMKEQIQKEVQESSEKIGRHSLFDRFVMQEQKYKQNVGSNNEILQLMQINLETSLRQNSVKTYESIAEHILRAGRKVIIGLRGGKGCAVQFARLLGHITDGVSMIIDEGHDQICSLAELDENDVAVYLHFPRYYKIDEKLAGILVQRKVPYYLITDSMASPIARHAEEVLLVETEHCGFFHSMLGVTGILEYLVILMCWRDPEVFRGKLKERDAILADYRIE